MGRLLLPHAKTTNTGYPAGLLTHFVTLTGLIFNFVSRIEAFVLAPEDVFASSTQTAS